SVGVLLLGAAALTLRLVRRAGRPTFARSFGRALLFTEATAIAGAALVPRVTTQLAQSGYMACAVPTAVVLALTWGTRDAEAPLWKRALVVLALSLWTAA